MERKQIQSAKINDQGKIWIIFVFCFRQERETFEVTPKMSTYLLAFIVSKFECRSNANNTFSVCSRPNAFNQTKYSFDVGQPLLNNFDEIFDYKYSTHMKKIAMAALPDFSAGAMENWGQSWKDCSGKFFYGNQMI